MSDQNRVLRSLPRVNYQILANSGRIEIVDDLEFNDSDTSFSESSISFDDTSSNASSIAVDIQHANLVFDQPDKSVAVDLDRAGIVAGSSDHREDVQYSSGF